MTGTYNTLHYEYGVRVGDLYLIDYLTSKMIGVNKISKLFIFLLV